MQLTDRQREILLGLLDERIEDVDADMEHFTAFPDEINADLEEGDEPLTLDDYQGYRDELTSLREVVAEIA